MKKCSDCGLEKPLSDFYVYRKGYVYCRCKTCHIAKSSPGSPGYEKKLSRSRELHRELRIATFDAYGGSICICCGETILEFLSIDHINGNGGQERKSGYAAGGAGFYRRLKRDGYPPGYQVLCHNCNMAKGFYGVCPHQIEGQV